MVDSVYTVLSTSRNGNCLDKKCPMKKGHEVILYNITKKPTENFFVGMEEEMWNETL